MAATENFDTNRAELIADMRKDMEKALRRSSSIYNTQVKNMEQIYGEEQKNMSLNQLQRILIALGMAVLSGSESSIEWTITRALNHGGDEKMIRETIDIALLNGGTFVVSNARFAYNTLELRKRKPRGS